jgi:hypothetical protein
MRPSENPSWWDDELAPGFAGLPGFAAALPTPNVTATTTRAPSESIFRSILITSFLEPHVLQGLRRTPVERGRGTVVTAA